MSDRARSRRRGGGRGSRSRKRRSRRHRRGPVPFLSLALLFLLAAAPALPAQEAPRPDGSDTPARAQPATPPDTVDAPPLLTLDEALERAARHDPDYRAARNELRLSGAERRAAWGAFLPDLSLNLGTTLSFNRRRVSEDFFGNPIDNPGSEWETTSSSRQSVTGSLTLFEGMGRFGELEAIDAEARARDAEAGARLVAVEAEVASAYFETMRRRDLRAVEEELLESRRRDLEVTTRRFELAGVTRVDLLTARQELEQQEQALRRARAEHRKARLVLARTIGDPELERFRVAETPPDPGAEEPPDEEALVARALERGPEVTTVEAGVRAAEARARAAGGSRWPTVALSYGFTQNTFEQEGSGLFDPFPDEGRFANTGLSLSVPVFNNFQTGQEVTRAGVEAENARERLRSTRLEVEERVRSRVVDVNTAREELELARRVRELAEERLELAREQYRLGVRSFTDLQRDIDAAVAARRGAIGALYDVLEARLRLEEAVGGR